MIVLDKIMKKISIYTILITLLLSTSFLLALLRLEQPHTHTSGQGDSTRDYLVAHYIAQDGERPLVVYYDGGIRGSPLYFYLLAGFLKIKDSVFFLGVVNIFFQIVTIFLIYLITKSLLGPFKAILSSLLFATIPAVFKQSEFVYTPHQMQPFAYLALLLLILSYKKNNFKIALFSLGMLCFAGTLYSAAFAWVPVFLILIFWMVRKKKQKIKFYIATCFTLILSISIFYLPVLVYYLKNPQVPLDLGSNSINNIYPMPSTQNFIPNLFHYISSVMKALSLNLGSNFQIDHLIAATLIIGCLIYYLFTQNMKTKTTVFIGTCFVISPMLLASLFSTYTQPLRYVLFTFGIFATLITEIVISSVNHMLKPYSHRLRIFITLIIILFLVKTMSSDFTIAQPNKHPERLLALNGAVSTMEHEISKIQARENFPRPNFFQIVSYAHTLEWYLPFYAPLNSVFLLPLEKNLKTKLARTEDGAGYWGLKQTNDDNFIFLICIEYSNKYIVKDCTSNFSQYYPNHRVIKNIYTKYPLSVYLTKNIYQMN